MLSTKRSHKSSFFFNISIFTKSQGGDIRELEDYTKKRLHEKLKNTT